MKLGSLFDGSGTAPLAASMCGIEPVWASEIEPYPIRVTKARFPNMKHLGSITDIHGAEIEPVDIICGGSPCQDLSVAGKQAGLHEGERSHLFFEMTRIIKEMRKATNGKYPRYIIWENVPGAFSSNKGRDFLAVLQAFAEIADPDIHVPEPKQKASGAGLAWKYAGYVAGDGWSIAWRTVDAQYWGVPQRRRRIYLVTDLGGERADEILFERTGLSGDSEPGRTQGKETAADAGGSTEGSSGIIYHCIARTLTAEHDASPCVDRGQNVVVSVQGNVIDRDAKQNGNGISENISHTINSTDRHGVAYTHVYDCRGNGCGMIVPTLTGDHQNRVTDYTALAVGNGQLHQISMAEQANCLDCMHDQQAVLTDGKPPRKYIVRRLTPLECCRLQGFPDWWEDGVEGSDSARYKMWGNGMALPNMLHVMQGIARMDGEPRWR